MATEAQIAPNRENSQASSGPVTLEGKQTSARNSLVCIDPQVRPYPRGTEPQIEASGRSGLFTSRDLVQSEEHEEYNTFVSEYEASLQPEGIMEKTYATEITSAAWRLRRCLILENLPGRTEDAQKSIDRARAHAHNVMRRSLAELRRLQTERQIRREVSPDHTIQSVHGVASTNEIVQVRNSRERNRLLNERVSEMDGLTSFLHKATAPPQPELASFCKTAAQAFAGTPRNSQCPCNSGRKYKRCCGINAPAVLGEAA